MPELLTLKRLKETLHYDPETGMFTRLTTNGGVKVGQEAGYVNNSGYRAIEVLGNRCLAHRLGWFYIYGEWPRTIDHINRDKLDNRIVNLRNVDDRINAQNCGTRKHNTSGHRGVYWHKPTANWTAMVFHRGKTISLGYFDTREEAIQARLAGERKHYDRPDS